MLESISPDDPRWVSFLATQPEATVFHHPAWLGLLARSYGYKPLVLVHRAAGDDILAGLPLVDTGGLRTRRLVALPFTDYCPPLANQVASFARELGEWREANRRPEIVVHAELPGLTGMQLAPRGFRHVVALDRDPERTLSGLGGKMRWSIRKAQREGLQIRIGRSPADLDPFYQLHLMTRHRLGVPIQPRRFMERLFEDILGAGLGFVIFACLDNRPIAGAVFLAWNGNLIYKYSASDPRYWKLRPNDLQLWSAIEWGYAHGYRQLDLGRTDREDQSLLDFKRRWGSVEAPLSYSYTYAPGQPSEGLAMRALTRVIKSSPPVLCRAAGEILYGPLARRLA